MPFALTVRRAFGLCTANDLRVPLARFGFGDQQAGANQRRSLRRRPNIGDQCGVRVGAFFFVGYDKEVCLQIHVGHNVAGFVLLVGGPALSIQNEIQTALFHQIQAIAGDLRKLRNIEKQ